MTASIDEIQSLLAEWEQAKAAVPAAARAVPLRAAAARPSGTTPARRSPASIVARS